MIRPKPLTIKIDESNYQDFEDLDNPVKYEREEGFNPVIVRLDTTEIIPNNVSRVDIPCSAYAIEHERTFTVNELTDLLYDTTSSIKLIRKYGVASISWDTHVACNIFSDGVYTFTPGEYYTTVDGNRVRADYFSEVVIKATFLPVMVNYVYPNVINTNGQTIIPIPNGTYPSSVAVDINVPPPNRTAYTVSNPIISNGNTIINIPSGVYPETVELNVNVPQPDTLASYRYPNTFTTNAYGDYSKVITVPDGKYANKIYFQINVPDEVPEIRYIVLENLYDETRTFNLSNAQSGSGYFHFDNENPNTTYFGKKYLYMEFFNTNNNNMVACNMYYLYAPTTIPFGGAPSTYCLIELAYLSVSFGTDLMMYFKDQQLNVLYQKHLQLDPNSSNFEQLFQLSNDVINYYS